MATSYEGFYGGADSTFDPGFGNLTDYSLSAVNLGFPGSPQSANQVQDTVNAIKHGTKTFEVTMLQPDVGETIPKQHFEEMRALMKLTGVKPSVHGPLIDAAGFGEQGWQPGAREDGERRMFAAIEKAQVLDPSGNLPFVIHAANGAPGTEWRPGDEKKGEDKWVMESGAMVNTETGQIQTVKREEKWRPSAFSEGAKKRGEYGKPQLFDVEGSVGSANLGDWENKLTEVAQMNKHAEELIGAAPMNLAEYQGAVRTREGIVKINEDGSKEVLPEITSPGQVDSFMQLEKAGVFMENAELSFKSTFGQAYKHGSDKQRDELEKLAKNYTKDLDSTEGLIWNPHERRKLLDNAILGLRGITAERGKEVNGKIVRDDDYGTPQIYKLSEEFAMEKAAKTFGNLAARGYDSWKEKAPVLAIENMMMGQFAFARAEDMKKLVGKSRDNFAEQLVDKGMDKKKAKKMAEDKLGVTWDVGHLNLHKKKGFTQEDVIEETRKINEDKSMVKHIHLTDNFGFADTHLVPGMGNVPIKEILQELEKNGRFDEMRKITEAGGVVQHFKKLPHSMTLAALGSPIYGMGAQGNWNQAVEMQGAYFGGYGNLNPATHHTYFGAGFTTMPVELGGQMAGGQSRFGGAPMA